MSVARLVEGTKRSFVLPQRGIPLPTLSGQCQLRVLQSEAVLFTSIQYPSGS